MATKNLKTDWKVIGRSGATVDGREIKPEMLEQAAKNYKKDTFTALIWPEHFRWFNMGQVEQLRAVDNSEGGKDLLAIISPNDFYLNANSAGQKLFTSIELMPNFRKTGEWYLTGLGATDDPASAGTSQMQFSATNADALLSKPIESAIFTLEQKPSFVERMAKLFTSSNPEDSDMADKQAIEALTTQFAAMQAELTALKAGGKSDGAADDKKPEDKPDDLSAKFAALEQKVDAWLVKFTVPLADNGKEDLNKKLTDFDAKFAALSQKLEDALKEADGTKTKEFSGSGGEETQTDC
jgi:hypothetical protein